MRTILKLLSRRYPLPLSVGSEAGTQKLLDQWTRASWQHAILAFLQAHAVEWSIRVRPAMRLQIRPDCFELADVAVYDRALPTEQVLARPPRAVFEIVSPDAPDKLPMNACANFAAMGVEQVWLVDTVTKRFLRYAEGRLTETEHFGNPGEKMHFRFAGIETFLD